ncbi:MAG: DUF979 domain-containing protein [Dokdonella sp.]
MLRIEHIYWLVGALLLGGAWFNARERHWTMACFWAILACPFLFGGSILTLADSGNRLPAQAMGVGVLALGFLAARHSGLRGANDESSSVDARQASASRLGNRLFGPALLIPLVTLLIVLTAGYLHWGNTALIDARQTTLIALGIACVVALLAALRVTRSTFSQSMREGRRLLDALGWAALLPMVLATLGSVFAATGVGDAISALVSAAIPVDNRYACLLAFAFGMVVFTIIMGNAFAAFPVMMAGIGLPLLINGHHAEAASLGALGMLTGYCGTLLTPMAANFNIVPAVLLELDDQYAVIRAQFATALALLVVNIGLMAVLVFR